MTDNSISHLDNLSDYSHFGGKAINLNNLIRLGFNVPKGFVVGINHDANSTDTILNHFDKLQTKLVAVRSSAINEDGVKDSFAGQFDTFLNVDRDNLIDKITKCRESNKSARLKSYLEQKNIKNSQVAVIVQEMIDGDVSGVAFSRHPVFKDKSNLIIIESVNGLGESLVSGMVTPDYFEIDKNSMQILNRRLSNENDIQKINDEIIIELCNIINKIESTFGHPIDIEWTIKNNIISILQTRPITTI